jgi:hypothetical protein
LASINFLHYHPIGGDGGVMRKKFSERTFRIFFIQLFFAGGLLLISGCQTSAPKNEIMQSEFHETFSLDASYKYLTPCWEMNFLNEEIARTDEYPRAFMVQFNYDEIFPRAIINEITQSAELRWGTSNFHVLMILKSTGTESTIVDAFTMTKNIWESIVPQWINVLRYCEKEYEKFKKES